MISIIVGTNRKNSETLRVAKYYQKTLEDRNEDCQILDLANLPHDFVYTALYGAQNEEFNTLVEQYIFSVEKLIVVTPEYNGSFPGVMKAFIDGWNPRRVFNKWVALVGVSSGRQGNARGMDDLTNVFNYLKINVIPIKPPMSQISDLLNENNEVADDGMKGMINMQLDLLLEK
jgi:NAD(P)H-dependent FMN reductase